MSSLVVASVLQQDTTDRSPNVFVSSYPQFFASASSVPVYLYQSLKTIWMGDPSASAIPAYQALVTSDIGTGLEPYSAGAITVIQSDLTDSVSQPDKPFNSDSWGAETCKISVVINKPRATQTTASIFNAAYRIRYILDNQSRNNRNLGYINPSADPSINPAEPFVLIFEDYAFSGKTSIQALDFSCAYTRLFLA